VQTFTLTTEFIALNRLLKAIGWAETGGHAHELIDSGAVTLDGEVETQRRKKIRTGMVVACEGNVVTIVNDELLIVNDEL
jgi:ribosome-associated protein